MSKNEVRIRNVGVGEKNGRIVMVGELDLASIPHIKYDDYQRELEPVSKIDDLAKAWIEGANIPAVALVVRGSNYTAEKNGDHVIHAPVFCVDGQQRLAGAMKAVASGAKPYVLCEVYFDMTKVEEIQMFHDLNGKKRTKVSVNILLRNKERTSPLIQLLRSLCEDPVFPLAHHVQWGQRAGRMQFISAVSLLNVAGRLHAHLGSAKTTDTDELIQHLEELLAKVGKRVFRDNLIEFVDIIDCSWGIRSVKYKEGACYLRPTFLKCLADVLSAYNNHTRIWDGNRFKPDEKVRARIGQFPIGDNEVVRLSGSSGKAREHLAIMMRDHMAKGHVLRGRPANDKGVTPK